MLVGLQTMWIMQQTGVCVAQRERESFGLMANGFPPPHAENGTQKKTYNRLNNVLGNGNGKKWGLSRIYSHLKF